jgi:preprotein translocase subunit SecE
MASRTAASALGEPNWSHVAERRTNDVSRLRRFIDEAWSELKKVSWPTREQVRNLTVLVFVVSFAVGVYITVLDFGFSQIVARLVGG